MFEAMTTPEFWLAVLIIIITAAGTSEIKKAVKRLITKKHFKNKYD